MTRVRRARALVLALLLAVAPELARAETWTLDPALAAIRFRVTVAGMGEATGRFDRITGALELDADRPGSSRLEVQVAADSLAADSGLVEETLRGPGFFAVDRHPVIAYRSREILVDGPRAVILGDLTLRGVTRSLVLNAEVDRAPGGPLEVTATGRLDRTGFGMTDLRPLVGDLVTLDIEAAFVR